MKYWLTIMLVLQMFGLHAETIKIATDPDPTCELKFEKDIFSAEERDLIAKDITRMFM